MTPITDRPLPDPEKSTLTPPPVHEHPFFHPLPGQSAEIPTYHPGMPVHTNLTPKAPQKSTMGSHPTYHISQLSTHPAFRASKPPSPPRESGFPRRTSEVQKYRSLSPVQNNSRHQIQNQNQSHNSTQTYQNQNRNQQSWRHSELSSTTASALTSPVVGRSELEADVPSTYLSPNLAPPTTYNNNTPSDFDYTNKWTDRRSQMTPISRGNTDSSKYSIPIGLGVDPSSLSNPVSSPNHQRNPTTRHELETPIPDLRSYNPSTVNVPSLSISTSAQMLGPLGPNLNSPRDGGHIMSWADSYSRSHSFRPTPNSTSNYTNSASRSQSQPHLRSLALASDEKEVLSTTTNDSAIVSPMSPERWSGATAVQSPVQQDHGHGGRLGERIGEETPTPLSAGECTSACLSPEAGTGTWGSWSGR